MGLSKVNFGKCVSQEIKQGEEIVMGSHNSFIQSYFCMNNKKRRGKKSIGVGTTMEGEL
jgi:hypothetical protein